MKLSIAFSSLAALVFPGSVVGQPFYYWTCDPTLPCGEGQEIFSCPCATEPSVSSLGKSGKASSGSLSGVCGFRVNRDTPNDWLSCLSKKRGSQKMSNLCCTIISTLLLITKQYVLCVW
jgi:hypothetical protein